MRMWIQAANTMTAYQAVTDAAVASAPPADAAPPIVVGQEDGDEGANSGDIIDNDGGDPTQASWRGEPGHRGHPDGGPGFLRTSRRSSAAISQLQNDLPLLVADEFTHVGEVISTFPQLQALVPLALTAPLANVGFAGAAGLAGLAGIQPAAVAPTVPAPAVAPANLPAVAGSPVVTTAAPAPSLTPAPSSAVSAAATPASAAAPPAPPCPGPAGYPYLVGGPSAGFGSTMSTSARRKAVEPDQVAAPGSGRGISTREGADAPAASGDVGHRGYRHEFLGSEAEPAVSGAGPLGFAGTLARGTVAGAAGLAQLADGGFGGAPVAPMLPRTWAPDPEPPDPGIVNENHIQ